MFVWCSWPLLATFWSLLAALASLLAPLGPLLAALGPLLRRHAKIIKKSMPKMTDLGSQNHPKMAPKSDQKATGNQCKKRSEKRTEIRSSWGRLGTILGHFRSPLGVKNIDFSLVFVGFREKSRFSKNSVSRAVLSPTWPILGRFWPPKRLQDGSQKRPKTKEKTCWFFITFLIDFWAKKRR